MYLALPGQRQSPLASPPERKRSFRNRRIKRKRRLKFYSFLRRGRWYSRCNSSINTESSRDGTSAGAAGDESSLPLLKIMALTFSLGFASSCEGSLHDYFSNLLIEVASWEYWFPICSKVDWKFFTISSMETFELEEAPLLFWNCSFFLLHRKLWGSHHPRL